MASYYSDTGRWRDEKVPPVFTGNYLECLEYYDRVTKEDPDFMYTITMEDMAHAEVHRKSREF